MKKFISTLMAIVFAFGVASARDQIVYNDSPLPANARQAISNIFKSKVNHVKIDKNILGNVEDYDVTLKNGTEVTFDVNGNIKEVEAGVNGVPEALLLPAIVNYVKKNCKKQKIVQLDVKKNSYEIELTDGRELVFDRAGKFLREER